MIGIKFLMVIPLLSLCSAIVIDENDIKDLEDNTLSYDFEEKLDKVIESLTLVEKKIALLEKDIALRQTTDQNQHTLSTAIGENWNVKSYINEVKCPNDRLPASCSEVAECKTDVYSIMIPSYSNHSFAASCDLETENGGWTVIQRRQDGSVDFYRNWTEYVEGFGDIGGEFFIGLEKLHLLTTDKPQELYITLEDFEGVQRYAKYGTFKVDSMETDYKLTVGNYSGDAGDSFTFHNGQKFSTWDRDNDKSNCAQKYIGAWWHTSCYHRFVVFFHYSNLNGKYLMGKLSKSKSGQGISWNQFRGDDYSLKSVQMMIRPRKD